MTDFFGSLSIFASLVYAEEFCEERSVEIYVSDEQDAYAPPDCKVLLVGRALLPTPGYIYKLRLDLVASRLASDTVHSIQFSGLIP